MPYPNEHSCRLREPAKGAETRRKNGARKHNGKPYDVIFQKQDGKWVEQAYRYPKDEWDSDEARSHCSSHDGSFEKAKDSEEKSAMEESCNVKTKMVPRSALTFRCDDETAIEFAISEDKATGFSMHAYTGAPMENWFFGKVVIDVEGITLRKKRGRTPILREHRPEWVVGSGRADADDSGVWIRDGEFYQDTYHGREVSALAARKHPWEASISIDQVKGEELAEGEKAEVNGRVVRGPAFVVRKSRLREVSFVSLGADANTSAIAAAEGPMEAIEITEDNKMTEEKSNQEPEVKVDLEAEKKAAAESAAKAERERFSALVNEFGQEFAVKAFADGMSIEDARLNHYEQVKEEVKTLREEVKRLKAAAPNAAEIPGEAPPIAKGAKGEEEKPTSFKAAWQALREERNKAGENLTPFQAMKLAQKLYPDLDIRS